MSTSPTERRHGAPARAGALLLLATGLGAAGLVLLTGRTGRPVGQPALRRPAPTEAVSARPGARREPLDRLPVPLAPAEERAAPPTHGFAGFHARFAALAAHDPRALEPLAQELFARAASEDETLALLSALRASRSPQSAHWHTEAVRGGRARRDGHGAGLAETALASLCADAAFDGAARTALARLAFESPGLAPGLRRRAAAAHAAHADDAELARLAVALAREADALLVEGCLVALGERTPGFAGEQLLLAHGRSTAPPVPAGPE